MDVVLLYPGQVEDLVLDCTTVGVFSAFKEPLHDNYLAYNFKFAAQKLNQTLS